jgi:hypothetical protein
VTVPALHDPATDRAVPYTPVCSHAPVPVCLHPAYAADNELSALTTMINKVAAPLAGAAGMPVRAEQLAGGENGEVGFRMVSSPPVLTVPHFIVHGTTIDPPRFAEEAETAVALALVTPPGTKPEHVTAIQRSAATYLLDQAGYAIYRVWLPTDASVTAAANRIAALGPAWLRDHVSAIRNGDLTPQDIP